VGFLLSSPSKFPTVGIETTKLLDQACGIGQKTAINSLKAELGHVFTQWDADAVNKRQSILMELALQTWLINGKRVDALSEASK
jgi:hypothetical protein